MDVRLSNERLMKTVSCSSNSPTLIRRNKKMSDAARVVVVLLGSASNTHENAMLLLHDKKYPRVINSAPVPMIVCLHGFIPSDLYRSDRKGCTPYGARGWATTSPPLRTPQKINLRRGVFTLAIRLPDVEIHKISVETVAVVI